MRCTGRNTSPTQMLQCGYCSCEKKECATSSNPFVIPVRGANLQKKLNARTERTISTRYSTPVQDQLHAPHGARAKWSSEQIIGSRGSRAHYTRCILLAQNSFLHFECGACCSNIRFRGFCSVLFFFLSLYHP